MSFDYVVCVLIVVGILLGFGWWKLIGHYNYELNFKESLIYSFPILILTILGLVDYSIIRKNLGWEISICIASYFVIMLIIYYITRFIKLKKYIPAKSIIGYVVLSVINLVILFILLENYPSSNIDGWDALGLYFFYILLSCSFIVLLLLINAILIVIKVIKKNNPDYNNCKYKISKCSYINIFIIILLIGIIFGIDYYNGYKSNRLLQKQRDIVIKYLNKEYPNYNFEIINIYETDINCSFLFCNTPGYKNEIRNIELNEYFNLYIKKSDLTIYEDEFKEIVEDEQKSSKEEKIKKYLKDNYNVSLNYKVNNEKLENIEFIIGKKYQNEEIDLFTQDMKSVFNYVDNNFYDIDYVVLIFENGNPFYDGKYEYQKTHGSINENEFTNELWIIVNDEYIFVDKN